MTPANLTKFTEGRSTVGSHLRVPHPLVLHPPSIIPPQASSALEPGNLRPDWPDIWEPACSLALPRYASLTPNQPTPNLVWYCTSAQPTLDFLLYQVHRYLLSRHAGVPPPPRVECRQLDCATSHDSFLLFLFSPATPPSPCFHAQGCSKLLSTEILRSIKCPPRLSIYVVSSNASLLLSFSTMIPIRSQA